MINVPFLVKHDKEYYRLISHGFIHADWMHLILNMYVFYNFGPFMENFMVAKYGITGGRILFSVLYLGALIFGSIPSMRKHGDHYEYRSLGASGAVSAILIVFMVTMPLAGIGFFFVPMPAYVGALLFFAVELILHKRGNTIIAHDAHMFGAVFGLLFLALTDFTVYIQFFKSVGAHLAGLF